MSLWFWVIGGLGLVLLAGFYILALILQAATKSYEEYWDGG